MLNYIFHEEATGEEFIVQAGSSKQALEIAIDICEEMSDYYGESCAIDSYQRISEYEAEMLGLDVY